MITKYKVNDDNIDLYEGEEIIAQIPNNEGYEDIPRLFNNLVFVNKDIDFASKRERFYHSKLKKNAIITLILGVGVFLNLNSFNGIILFLLMLNLLRFFVNKSKYDESAKRLDYYKDVENNIKTKLCNLKIEPNASKISNCSLEFTNEQITMDHQEWVKKIGDYYDYQGDLNTIENNKMLIKFD